MTSGALRLPLHHSVQIIRVLPDVFGEAERVVAHELFGASGVACLDRLDNMHVIMDRTIRAVLLADGAHPDHAHMREQILGERDQYAIAAHADDGLVKLDVRLGVFVEMGAHSAIIEVGEHAPQRRDLVVACIFRNQARGHTFECSPGRDHLDDFAPGFAHDVDAAARHRAHKTFAFELRHRLAHRGATDAEVLRQTALVEPHFGATAGYVAAHAHTPHCRPDTGPSHS